MNYFIYHIFESIANDYYEQMEKFSNKQIPGPGYYIDMDKQSDFYKKSIPYPEFKQFFLSNIK